MTDPEVSRRHALRWLGAAGATAVVAGCGGSKAKTATATSTPATSTPATVTPIVTCTLTPEMTEGPYYLSGEPTRRDITEGSAGTPMQLTFTVVDIDGCAVLPDASVEIWHADAGGNYSDFGSAASSRTFLRGAQTTAGDGRATFKTIYPGWYQGRATHIHIKVHTGGNVVHTGQLFFDEAMNSAVYANSPYNAHSGTRTLNSQDGIYSSGGAQSLATVTNSGSTYVATATLGVKRS
jgi:protocatechuate 3,4-dioxygenase beta subunit